MKESKNKLLVRYLADNCTDEELQAIESWKQNDIQNRKLLEEYESLWKKSAVDNSNKRGQFDAKQGWQLLNEKIERNNSALHQSKKTSYSKLKNQSFKYRLISAAAIFLAIILIGFYAYQSWNPSGAKRQKPSMQIIATDNGQRTHITLSDETHILLNADSKLRVPAVFKQNKREVFLQGQAYFNVTENANRPFIIHTNGTTIRVLGTSFAISSYPKDHSVQVVVKKGRVVFKTDRQTQSTSTILTANEVGRYSEQTQTILTQTVQNLNFYLGWIEGRLNFEQTPMTEVAVSLERRYDIKVKFKNKEIKKMALTAHLQSKRIRNVLDVIAISLQIEYKLKNDNVIFYQ